MKWKWLCEEQGSVTGIVLYLCGILRSADDELDLTLGVENVFMKPFIVKQLWGSGWRREGVPMSHVKFR